MTDRLTRNWLLLIALILATTGLATQDGGIAAAGLLALAWAKSRAILGGFLHLDRAPEWLSAFLVPLGLWLALVWGLAAVR
ncbi:cytochrome C oxidase subunit IV family protein [Paracoccus aerius]|uniref:Cytochrome C oxidase subunit IV family protein n=1 Tax=Paracoccus aerius TaxID=1915382 RepID=A0ABS1S9J4_9RHOB|nr:cytochrome C oxidase subunit IV family protein [Paracoccus aerius]MBL3675379.1 cytochrome C oxidase subunit IV family protein [Paracoccus aerius]GHG33020.1 hypothetical protein GCM10017322_35100 [Paracoccus aerius]